MVPRTVVQIKLCADLVGTWVVKVLLSAWAGLGARH